MHRALEDAASAHGGSVEIAWTREYEGFSLDPDAPALVLVEQACADIGVSPRRFTTGGGSDGNILAAHGVPTLVLSSGMSQVHSTEEELSVAELERLVDLLVAVARRAAE
jgi:tripeptide aminopeptidase